MKIPEFPISKDQKQKYLTKLCRGSYLTEGQFYLPPFIWRAGLQSGYFCLVTLQWWLAADHVVKKELSFENISSNFHK